MSATAVDLDTRLTDAFREHLARGDEQTLHEAYELARRAVEEGLGVVDMASMLLKAWRSARGGRAGDPQVGHLPADPAHGGTHASEALERFDAFALECFSPFEMEYRGTRDATRVLRRINDRGEENMRRIAYELHDTAGQLLTTVHFALDAAERRLGPASANALVPVRKRLEEVELELRRLSHELRPTLLDHLGLLPALRELARGVSARSGLEIQVHDATSERLPAPVETALYRITQEALTNVARHAHAGHVRVTLRAAPGEMRLEVDDDGVGIGTHRPGQGIGLTGIGERVRALGGTVSIRSDHGTRLLVNLPMPSATAVAA